MVSKYWQQETSVVGSQGLSCDGYSQFQPAAVDPLGKQLNPPIKVVLPHGKSILKKKGINTKQAEEAGRRE